MKRSSLSVKKIRNNLFVIYHWKLIWMKFTLICLKQMNMNDSFQSSVSKILQRSIKLMWSDKLSFKYNNQRANWWLLWPHKDLNEHKKINSFLFLPQLPNCSICHLVTRKSIFLLFKKETQWTILIPWKMLHYHFFLIPKSSTKVQITHKSLRGTDGHRVNWWDSPNWKSINRTPNLKNIFEMDLNNIF